ncbi:hypothetical protein E5329_01355 [Petralouisia muris]|jgi:hypothetical protein|uniref:Uncharacterized protein n=1 Tax=Petralouisia muris TaxID=3032872 RepID=A0AC61S293_9FIRM|nr:hypothetical protein [Petralouisia muris]TGY98083.1 hypothetical protein E5329_01355 [Petralouisia muris]
MNPQDILNNPQLQKNISPDKLKLLIELASNNSANASNPQAMAESLKNASESVKNQGVDFSSAERDLIIEVLKQSMPPQEQKRVDLLMQMMKNMRK